MARFIRTPHLARTQKERQRVVLAEAKVLKKRFNKKTSRRDIDKITTHIVKMHGFLQNAVWKGGFKRGKDEKVLFEVVGQSFQDKRLEDLMDQAWNESNGTYGSAILIFLDKVAEGGVYRTQDPSNFITLRSGRAPIRCVRGEEFYSIPEKLKVQVVESILVTYISFTT